MPKIIISAKENLHKYVKQASVQDGTTITGYITHLILKDKEKRLQKKDG